VNLANDVDAEMDAILKRGVVSRHFPAALDHYLAASPAMSLTLVAPFTQVCAMFCDNLSLSF
jgi:hypothetical protein